MAALAAWLRLGLSAGISAIAATTWLNSSIRGLDGVVFGAWLLSAVLGGALALGILAGPDMMTGHVVPHEGGITISL